MATIIKNLGPVTAYKYAVQKGYTGTEEEFAELMASYADVAEEAAESAAAAATSATAASGSASTASTKASEAAGSASAAAGSASAAGTKASEAAGSATAAAGSASTASTKADEAAASATAAAGSATTAGTKAGEAASSASAAASSKTAAQAAQTAAEAAQTAAETAQGEAEDAAASVSESAAQIATNTEDISQLKSDFDDLTDDLSTLANLQIFENGSITANNGTNTNSSARIRTKTYIDSRVIGAVAASGYEFNVYAYSNGTYIGCIQSDGSLGKTSSVKYVTRYIFSNEYDYRLVLRNTSGTDITSDVYSNLYFLVPTDESLTQKYKSADAKVVGDKVSDLQNRIVDTILGTQDIVVDSHFGVDWMELGALNSSGAELARTDSYRCGFLPCYSGSKITSAVTLTNTSGISWYHYICFYDSTETFISREGGSKDGTVTASAPEDAVYYRVSLTYVVAGNVASYSLTNTLNNANAVSPKTKWYVLGDSISAGYYSMTESMAEEQGITLDYISPVASPEGEVTGSVWDKTLSHNYWSYANDWFLHQTLVGLAIPGQGYFHTATYNNKNGVNVVDENSFADAGLITVAWGFNDWHYNMQRGDHTLIDPSVPVPTVNYDTTQIETINHAIWYCLGRLIQKAPTAKIVVQTPMNGWAYGGDFSTNWGIGYSMSQSDTLKDIHDDIIYWCDYYGLQYIDMTFNNSIVNRVNIKDTIIDGSHPSDEAHKQLARTVRTKIGY